MAHLLNPFALVVSEVDSTEGTNLEEELAKFEAEHEKDMVRIDEIVSEHAQKMAKLEDANEKQAKVNEVVDERLQRLELMIPRSPAPNERAPLRTPAVKHRGAALKDANGGKRKRRDTLKDANGGKKAKDRVLPKDRVRNHYEEKEKKEKESKSRAKRVANARSTAAKRQRVNVVSKRRKNKASGKGK